jgi:hypothetical protein
MSGCATKSKKGVKTPRFKGRTWDTQRTAKIHRAKVGAMEKRLAVPPSQRKKSQNRGGTANPECSNLNSFSAGLIARCGDENGPTHAGPEEAGQLWIAGTPSI